MLGSSTLHPPWHLYLLSWQPLENFEEEESDAKEEEETLEKEEDFE
jgi:hypothetical protein